MSAPELHGIVVWLTGPPASGKTTVACLVREELTRRGVPTLLLDSDELRRVMTPEPTYSEAERDTFYATIAYIAAIAARGGSIVLVAATAPRRAYRDRARQQAGGMVEVYLTCDRSTLERRDPKGLYAGARAGEVRNLPGYDAPYEAPSSPELAFDTDRTTAEEIAAAIVRFVGR